MASNNFVNVKLTWESCPAELLWIIFKNLDYKSLKNCLIINRRWKDVAVHYIEFYGLWAIIVSEALINMGTTFRRKSKLDWKDILINSILWSSVRSAHVEHRHTCRIKNVKKIHMYKDILIVKTTKNVKHFDFNFEQVGYYKSSREEIDWTENDFMTIALDEALFLRSELQAYQLRLCGKLNPDVDSGHTHHSLPTLKDILLYRLDDNICYIVSHKKIVWALLWDGKDWDHELRGRYYGNKTDTIHALHVFNNKITMVTKYGKILCEDPESKSFKITVSHSNSKTESNWVLFNQADVAVSVPENSEGNRISREIKSNHMKLECAGMSCATEHGEMLFIGFKDGVVAICKPENMRLDRCEPELYLNVKDYTKNIKNPTVMAIEVFEDKLSHHLFVVIPHHIIHLVLTYPLNITEHYE